ncbi:MAG: response regulator transcription factor [Actinobacteria bacterium]|jgi:DNA-binding NarL/FixJ family response regulator|nr:response regulator transcription factor [Actinomycetota bacterium]MCL6094333.1 response regulator transcription factor [Actinomycetota bacterium]
MEVVNKVLSWTETSPTTAVSSEKGSSPEGVNIRVAICDDHLMLAQALADVLNRTGGIEVVGIATTAAQIEQLVKEMEPDVVLMDYDLPDEDGIYACGKILEHHPATKVVMLAAFADEAILARAIEVGCVGYVTKHKAVDEVVSAVKLVAAGEALIAPDMLARLLPRLRRGGSSAGSRLTRREAEVLDLLAEGLSNDAIAEALEVSPNTARNHVQSILAKLGAHSRLQAVAIASREGLIARG